MTLRAWQYLVRGVGGFTVPVYFVDADLPDNAAWDRTLTGTLYGGDAHYRLCQEVLLGVGGVRMLRALGYTAKTLRVRRDQQGSVSGHAPGAP